MKKVFSAILATALLLTMPSMTTLASEIEYVDTTELERLLEPSGASGDYVAVDDEPQALAYGGDAEELQQVDEFFALTKAESVQAAASAYPSADPLDYLKQTYPGTRRQFEGTCWAHSIAANAEFYSVKNGVLQTGTNTDLSEYQIAYFGYHSAEAPDGDTRGDSYAFRAKSGNRETWLTKGHNLTFVVHTLNQWDAIADEAIIPTPSQNLEAGLTEDKAHDSNHVVMTDARVIKKTEKDAIKNAIVANGIVSISYYADGGYAALDKNQQANWYCPDAKESNHAVAIVGWNDQYAASNFKKRPAGNGAWLVRNSWSTKTEYSINSYFWLSYYDKSINENVYALNFDLQSRYAHNYQYDGGNYTQPSMKLQASQSLGARAPKAANVFTANQSASDETLTAVNLTYRYYSDCNYKIEVYKNLKNDSPNSGTLVDAATTYGTTTYPGIYTVKLDAPVSLSKGEKFAVVVTTWSENNGSVTYYQPDREYAYTGWDWMTSTVAAKSGQSYTYDYGNQNWQTFSQNAQSGVTGNYCIKAFTVEQRVAVPAKYKVIYHSNDGKDDTRVESYAANATAKAADNPFKRDGYEFVSWNTKADGNGKNYAVNANITGISAGEQFHLYAKWKAETTEVKFDPNGGTLQGSETKLVTYGSTFGTLPLAIKDAYIFLGWFTQRTGGTPVTASSTCTYHGKITLYAQWGIPGYTLYLNPNGGSIDKSSLAVYFNKRIGTIPTPKRDGYTFTGWFTKTSGGTQYTPNTLYKSRTGMTVYARWSANTYAVTYSYNGGKQDKNNPNPTKYSVETRTTLMPAIRSGYRFTGWYLDKNLTKKLTLLSIAEIKAKGGKVGKLTLYAGWDANSYRITFDANGGSGISANQSITVKTGQKVGTLPQVRRTGYTFGGWFTKPTAGTKITATTAWKAENGTRLYAHWTKSRYTIKYMLSGGKNAGGSAKYYYYGEAVTLKKATRTGYRFVGWYRDAQFRQAISTTAGAAENLTVYAKWVPIRYSVMIYGANGNVVQQKSLEYTESVKVTDPGTGSSNKKFLGFATSASLAQRGKVKYRVGQSYKNLANVEGRTVSLYAVYR